MLIDLVCENNLHFQAVYLHRFIFNSSKNFVISILSKNICLALYKDELSCLPLFLETKQAAKQSELILNNIDFFYGWYFFQPSQTVKSLSKKTTPWYLPENLLIFLRFWENYSTPVCQQHGFHLNNLQVCYILSLKGNKAFTSLSFTYVAWASAASWILPGSPHLSLVVSNCWQQEKTDAYKMCFDLQTLRTDHSKRWCSKLVPGSVTYPVSIRKIGSISWGSLWDMKTR